MPFTRSNDRAEGPTLGFWDSLLAILRGWF